MKFESKFGVGEIVYYSLHNHENAKHDEFLEVVCIAFGKSGEIGYHCRWPGGHVGHFSESELHGDENFDQEAGCYREELNPDKADESEENQTEITEE